MTRTGQSFPQDGAPASLTDLQLFFTGSFDRTLAGTSTPVELFRHTLRTVHDALEDQFRRGVAVAELVHQRAWYTDELLIRAWDRFMSERNDQSSLVAVGGYGRGELHPHSDVDLLILLPPGLSRAHGAAVENFLAFLWDIGLKVGHSVRTVEECVEEAANDVGVATNLMESRRIAGSRPLFDEMRLRTGPARLWPPADFFTAKHAEQTERHRKYHGTAYRLEPNVKDGPGGLRDLQTIVWIAQRHFGTGALHDLMEHGFLTAQEYEELAAYREFLWKVRYALHLISGRDENRLLFDHQQALARSFGYQDDRHRLAVEQFMKEYYRAITGLGRLNEMLLQLLGEVILPHELPDDIRPINERFLTRNGFLETAAPEVFRQHPPALLELFLLMARHPELQGVGVTTARQIRHHLPLIDQGFRDDPRCRALFMEILRQPHGVTHELRRMSRYGILAAYFPAFGAIVGQMQYDLFHTYTVDEHTLYVVRNLRRFTIADYADEFALCSKIIKRIPRLELLYLAALFHDIAKGRGGDHSVLGADDAVDFCMRHGLDDHDARLVAWLVRHHLLMSVTAQHKDIDDPEVISAFAKTVGDQTRLDHLYLLTVADIRATNPGLWNNWRDALLKELYAATRRALARGLENPLARREQAAETQNAALALLANADQERIRALWETLDEDEYFLRHSADEIAWQTRQILGNDTGLPLISIREQTERGGTEIFIYSRDHEHLFALTTGALDQLGLNILSARIVTTSDDHTLDTYIVLDEAGNALHSPLRIEEIRTTIAKRIALNDPRAMRISRRAARQLRHFLIPAQVTFSDDIQRRYTVAEIVTVDRPGLLARIGRAFIAHGVKVRHAKIATFGERVEDVFFITDRDNRPLDDEHRLEALRNQLTETLDEH